VTTQKFVKLLLLVFATMQPNGKNSKLHTSPIYNRPMYSISLNSKTLKKSDRCAVQLLYRTKSLNTQYICLTSRFFLLSSFFFSSIIFK
jgi:hypothetical protein